MNKPIPPELESLADTRWGIGENADGTFNVFPPEELAARTDERDRQERAFAMILGAGAPNETQAADAEWDESLHPRGSPGNPGQFAAGGGGDQSKLNTAHLKKVGAQLGSNPGGIFQNTTGAKFYVKTAPTVDHARNEYLAAKLYQLAGTRTLQFLPTDNPKKIATGLEQLDKNRAAQLSPTERAAAAKDFAVHAWLANWDAVGLGGDNIGTVNGAPVWLDLGGALHYRAQGSPKGAAFGDKVGEYDTMRNSSIAPDAAKMFGTMTAEQLRAAVTKVVSIPDAAIRNAVTSSGSSAALADKLIARKADLAARVGLTIQ